MQLILHIGQPKTGSTSIQNFLKQNSDILLKNGYVYHTNTINHQAILDQIFTKENINYNKLKEFVSNTKQKAENNNATNIVMSSESLFNLKEEYIESLIKEFDLPVKVIVYLKRQDLYLESIWKQWHFKNLHFKDFYDFKEKFKIENYYEIIKKWQRFIDNPEDIIITPFEKRNFPEGLLKHFVNSIGLSKELIEKLDFEIKDSLLFGGTNRGLSPKGLELAFKCRELANGPLDYTLERFIDKYFKDLFKKEFFESYGLFKSKEDRIEYLRKFEEINKKIANEFLEREKLFLDEIKDEKPKTELTIDDIAKMIMYFGIKIDKEIENIKSNKKT